MQREPNGDYDGFVQSLQHISRWMGCIDTRLVEAREDDRKIIALLCDIKDEMKEIKQYVEQFNEQMCARDILMHIDKEQTDTNSFIKRCAIKGAWVLMGIGITLSAMLTLIELSGHSISDIISFISK